jgi:hypothetical protein
LTTPPSRSNPISFSPRPAPHAVWQGRQGCVDPRARSGQPGPRVAAPRNGCGVGRGWPFPRLRGGSGGPSQLFPAPPDGDRIACANGGLRWVERSYACAVQPRGAPTAGLPRGRGRTLARPGLSDLLRARISILRCCLVSRTAGGAAAAAQLCCARSNCSVAPCALAPRRRQGRRQGWQGRQGPDGKEGAAVPVLPRRPAGAAPRRGRKRAHAASLTGPSSPRPGSRRPPVRLSAHPTRSSRSAVSTASSSRA